MDIHAVIMAGGVGSRFWPMSTLKLPKQFIDVLGTGRTMIQMAFDRLDGLCPVSNVWVVTSAKYVRYVREQLPQLPAGNILAEPAARNTAPCIAYALWKIARRRGGEDSLVVFGPSDALVLDNAAYRKNISLALSHAALGDSIVTVGIRPTRPETGYGYIQLQSGLEACVGEGVWKVCKFHEKPDLDTARAYLARGGFLWNAGIFVSRVRTLERSVRSYLPDTAKLFDRMAAAGFAPEIVEELFPKCEKISIDYAVMEKYPDICTVPSDFQWSDLGTWGALLQNSPTDADGNAVVASEGARVRVHDCKGCVVNVDGLSRVELEGLQDCIVACRDGNLLVCRLNSEQKIKDFSE